MTWGSALDWLSKILGSAFVLALLGLAGAYLLERYKARDGRDERNVTDALKIATEIEQAVRNSDPSPLAIELDPDARRNVHDLTRALVCQALLISKRQTRDALCGAGDVLHAALSIATYSTHVCKEPRTERDVSLIASERIRDLLSAKYRGDRTPRPSAAMIPISEQWLEIKEIMEQVEAERAAEAAS